MNTKTLRNWILILAGLVLMSPLLVSTTTIFPSVVAKTFSFRLLVCLMLCLFLFLLFRNPKHYWQILKHNPIFWGGLIFLIAITVSSLFGVDLYASFWSGAERMAGILSYLFMFVYASILIAINPKKEDFEKLINFHFIAASLSSLSAILSYKYGFLLASYKGQRLTGVAGNPSFYGVYMIFTAFLALAMASRYLNKEKIKFWIYTSVAIISSLLIFGTGTRGDMLGLGIGLLVFLIYVAALKRKETIGKISLAILVIGFLGIASIFGLKNTKFVKNDIGLSRLVSIINFKTDITAQSRVWSYKTAINAWKEKPIFGWGIDNYKWGFLKHFIPAMVNNNPNDITFDKVHNMPLEILATTGVVGFTAYIFFFVCIFKTIIEVIRKDNENRLYIVALGCGIIAYFVSNFFLFDVFESFLLLGFFMALIGTVKNYDLSQEKYISYNHQNQYIAWIGSGLVLIFMVFGIFKPWTTASLYGLANVYLNNNNNAKAVSFLKQAVERQDFVSRCGLLATGRTLTQNTSKIAENGDRETIKNILISGLDKEIIKFPQFLDLQGEQVDIILYGTATPSKVDLQKAEVIINNLVVYAPDYLPYKVSQAFLNGLNGNFDKSLEASNFVIERTNKLPQVFWFKGIVLYLKGQKQEAMDSYLLALKNGYPITTTDMVTLKGLAQLNNRTDILDYIKANYINP